MRPRSVQVAVGTVAVLALVLAAFFFSPVSPAQAQTITHGTAVVNTSFLNVRGGPGSQFLVLGVVTGGTELPVTGVSADGDWWRVSTVFGEGFVFADFIVYRGNSTNVPIVRTSDVSAPTASSVVVLASALNVRSGPSINNPVLGVVPQSFVMTVIGQDTETGWYNVNSPFGPGWVANSEVALSGAGGGAAGLSISASTSAAGTGAVTSAGAASGTTTVAEEQLRFVPEEKGGEEGRGVARYALQPRGRRTLALPTRQTSSAATLVTAEVPRSWGF